MMRMNPTVTVTAWLLDGPVGLVPAAAQQDRSEDALHVVRPRDAIPAIVDPEFEPASKASLADHKLAFQCGWLGYFPSTDVWRMQGGKR